MRNPGVVISCLDKRHAFEAAAAAAEAGMLSTFVSGAICGRPWFFFGQVPGVVGAEELRNLVASSSGRISCTSRYFVPCKALGAIPGLRDTWLRTGSCLLSESAFDAFVARHHAGEGDLFHGFGRYACHSMKRARELGAVTVLDAFELHPLTEFDIETRQRRRVGLPENHRTRIRSKAMARRIAAYEHADVILACLETVRASLLEHDVRADRVRMLPLGADIPIAHTSLAAGKVPRGFRLIYVGPLHWFKGLHLLLDAWERLRLPEAELIVVGRPFPVWGEYFRARLRTCPQVRWVPGLPKEDLLQLLTEVDAMVFPSLVGGLGMVVYEAMAAGLPVIVPTGEGILQDGVHAIIAPPEEGDALGDAIVLLSQDADLRTQIGNAARRRIEEFTWDRYRATLAQEYRSAFVR